MLNSLAGGIRALRFSNASAPAGGGAQLVSNRPISPRASEEFAPAPPWSKRSTRACFEVQIEVVEATITKVKACVRENDKPDDVDILCWEYDLVPER